MSRQRFLTIVLLALVGLIAASWIPAPSSIRYESLDILGPAEYSSVERLRCEELPVDSLADDHYVDELRLESKKVTSNQATKVCQVTSGSRAESGRLRVTVRLYETPVEAYRWFAARQDEVSSEHDGQFRSSDLDPVGSTILLDSNAAVTITPTTEFTPAHMDAAITQSYFHMAEWILEEL